MNDKEKDSWHFCYWDEPIFNNKPKTKKMIEKVTPTGKKVLIKQKKRKTKTASGLFLPEIAQKNECKGVVIAKGQSVEEIKVGDVVQYTEHCLPTTMQHDGEDHLLIQEGDIFEIITETENV